MVWCGESAKLNEHHDMYGIDSFYKWFNNSSHIQIAREKVKVSERKVTIGCFTSLKSFITTFSYRWLYKLVDFKCILISWLIEWNVQTFKPRIFIYRRGKFMYHYWGWHQFIGHCLIPLDPWLFILISPQTLSSNELTVSSRHTKDVKNSTYLLCLAQDIKKFQLR